MKKKSVMVGGLALVLAMALSGPAFARGGGGVAGGMRMMGSSAGAGAGFAGAQGMKSPGSVAGDRLRQQTGNPQQDQVMDRLQDRERLHERSQQQERLQDGTYERMDDPARQRSGEFSGEQGQGTADRSRLRNPDLHQDVPPTAE